MERLKDEQENEEDNSENVKEEEVCPNCGGKIKTSESGERYCEDCGLVIEEDPIDYGPEWRAFNDKEDKEKSRVGSPRTPLLHDKGLATEIGRIEDGQNRERLERIKRWNRRFKTKDSKDRNLRQALGEIQRISSELNVPQYVREQASEVYRDVLGNEMVPGRTIEGMATASLYHSIRENDIPITIDEIEEYARVDTKTIHKDTRYMSRELGIGLSSRNPKIFINKVISDLDIENKTEVRESLVDIVDTLVKNGYHSGKNPMSIIAGSIYASAILTDEDIIQRDIAQKTGISEVTIRNVSDDILENRDEFPV